MNALHSGSCKRLFFASSTDHTLLLRNARVHRMPATKCSDGASVQQYVMASGEMDTAIVLKVPQLHLARLSLTTGVDGANPVLHGAKVINRTLGSIDAVCGKLVDTILSDIGKDDKDTIVRARGTLHGLSEWVLEGYRDVQAHRDSSTLHAKSLSGPRDDILLDLSTLDLNNVFAIANADTSQKWNKNSDAEMSIAFDAWESMTREFLNQDKSSESLLYQSKGAKLEAIEHLSDTSDFANTCGGAMAVWRF